ncbi:hypothetical protein [Fulvivirga ligni]|uniref:hypothetical protein n=1 Tax=Fulvivirga ligni TaxID=2904246 RepID=UPI001F1D8FA9|nr:hypothetical protein [Fulvivirga ligni]UII20462.1 hypothetical protein LVD16_21725 [Fulvivirga ligni]
METLKDHTIVYDDECPMCNIYTRSFVAQGLLDQKGRMAYGEVDKAEFPSVNWERARNEIALINRTDHSVTYGLDSLVKVIGHRYGWVSRCLQNRMVRYFMQHCYFFISYNRKVIAANQAYAQCSCAPTFNRSYRVAYIMLAWLFTSLVLVGYGQLLTSFVPETNVIREFLICGGQLVFQGVIMALFVKDKVLEYLGNMMTVSIIGALMLLPSLIAGIFTGPGIFYLGYFLLVVGFMVWEHSRRVKLLKLPFYLTVTWLVYRLTILLIIL